MTAHRQHRQRKAHQPQKPVRQARGGSGGPAGGGGGSGPGTKTRSSGRSGGPAGHRTTRHPKRSAAGLIIHDGGWVTGFNDEAPTCVPTAIANSLMLVTGLPVTDDDVLQLFIDAGGDRYGVSLAVCMAALATHGIGGHKLASRCCPATGEMQPGDIVGLAGRHAACFTTEGLISWGALFDPGEWQLDGEAWRISWAA